MYIYVYVYIDMCVYEIMKCIDTHVHVPAVNLSMYDVLYIMYGSYTGAVPVTFYWKRLWSSVSEKSE